MTLLTVALAAILVLFGVNLITRMSPTSSDGANANSLTLDRADVKGMAIEKEGKVFTLNQRQTESAVSFINRMSPVDKNDYSKKGDFDFTKLMIYRFNKPDITLVPIALERGNIVFDVPILSSSSYMLERSGGEFSSLIQKATEE